MLWQWISVSQIELWRASENPSQFELLVWLLLNWFCWKGLKVFSDFFPIAHRPALLFCPPPTMLACWCPFLLLFLFLALAFAFALSFLQFVRLNNLGAFYRIRGQNNELISPENRVVFLQFEPSGSFAIELLFFVSRWPIVLSLLILRLDYVWIFSSNSSHFAPHRHSLIWMNCFSLSIARRKSVAAREQAS